MDAVAVAAVRGGAYRDEFTYTVGHHRNSLNKTASEIPADDSCSGRTHMPSASFRPVTRMQADVISSGGKGGGSHVYGMGLAIYDLGT